MYVCMYVCMYVHANGNVIDNLSVNVDFLVVELN